MALKLPSALALHGFTGRGASWAQAVGLLEDCLTAVCPDLPGHAEAPLPARAGREGFEATVDGLAQLLRGPSVVIGYSQGARLALALAVRHPSRVRCLILESGTAGLGTEPERARRRQEDEAQAVELETGGVEAFICRWERLPLFAATANDRRLAALRRSHQAAGLAGALRCLGLGVQPDFWPVLPKVAVPTLLLTGANDPKFTALGKRLAQALPSARQVVVAGAGHCVHWEAPRAWSDEVRAFVRAAAHPQPHQSEELRR